MEIYDNGIRFGCRKCGACCISKRADMGVFLYRPDLAAMAADLKMTEAAFAGKYCLIVKEWAGRKILPRLQVKKKKDGSCIFLKKGKCSLYSVRPVLCRIGPFVHGFMESPVFFKLFMGYCRGLGKGRVRSRDEISGFLDVEKRLEEAYQIDLATDRGFYNILKS